MRRWAAAESPGRWAAAAWRGTCSGTAVQSRATAVAGSWLPAVQQRVLASGAAPGGGVSSSLSADSGGENTVAGSGTEWSSAASALVSVPAHGVAPAGVPCDVAAGPSSRTGSSSPSGAPAAGHGVPPPAAAAGRGAPEASPAPAPVSAPESPPEADAAEAAAPEAATPEADAPGLNAPEADASEVDAPGEAAPEAAAPAAEAPAAAASPRRSGMPILSAASWSHSGGLSRNDV